VELNDLKNVVHYAMDYIAAQVEGEEPKSALDRLIDIPDRLLTLLKATSLAAATDVLVRVKSHYPDVDMIKVKGGAALRRCRSRALHVVHLSLRLEVVHPRRQPRPRNLESRTLLPDSSGRWSCGRSEMRGGPEMAPG
jgi:hypothetical protein